MGNCMVIRGSCLFQEKKGKPAAATKAVPNGQTSRSMCSSNRAISSKLETTNTRSQDHIVIGKNLQVGEKRTSSDSEDEKSGAARVMRIRVVVTQSQLSQIMKESRNSASLSSSSAAVKQLLLTSAIKMSRTEKSLSNSIRSDQGGSANGKWRPRLQSISEE